MNETVIANTTRMLCRAGDCRPLPWYRDEFLGFIPPFLVWNIAVIVLVALIFWWLLRGSQKPAETPLELLQKRYVTGDVDRETYLQMKKDLTD